MALINIYKPLTTFLKAALLVIINSMKIPLKFFGNAKNQTRDSYVQKRVSPIVNL